MLKILSFSITPLYFSKIKNSTALTKHFYSKRQTPSAVTKNICKKAQTSPAVTKNICKKTQTPSAVTKNFYKKTQTPPAVTKNFYKNTQTLQSYKKVQSTNVNYFVWTGLFFDTLYCIIQRRPSLRKSNEIFVMSYFFICFFGEYLVEIEKISDFFGEKELQGVRGAYRLG